MSIRIAGLVALILLGVATDADATEIPAALADLPLIEVQPRGSSVPGPQRLVIFYSGDGGWATLDEAVSARLAAAGVRVVGMNMLRYLWHARSPEEATQDLARVMRTYLAAQGVDDQLLLVGYSHGADVLPFLVNRLPQQWRGRIAAITLLSPGHATELEIHIGQMLSGGSGGLPVMPEIDKLGLPLLCLYGGADDNDTLCPEIPADRATTAQIGSGHHLGGEYQAIADLILSFANSIQGRRPP
ncbi:AcvB/VirJ family lysyl-phosphatidylglycerol hydrolase [Povalibacter sp.]|uniref:AcvB/VirJ family lysyl-phosphatidylglycerol hydrolase n=1 Tax=Povalibacter sp. TaxID=1962978 RepID=UPI002F425482